MSQSYVRPHIKHYCHLIAPVLGCTLAQAFCVLHMLSSTGQLLHGFGLDLT